MTVVPTRGASSRASTTVPVRVAGCPCAGRAAKSNRRLTERRQTGPCERKTSGIAIVDLRSVQRNWRRRCCLLPDSHDLAHPLWDARNQRTEFQSGSRHEERTEEHEMRNTTRALVSRFDSLGLGRIGSVCKYN